MSKLEMPNAAETLEEAKRLIRGAITMRLEGMREDGEPIPEPTTLVDYAEVEAA